MTAVHNRYATLLDDSVPLEICNSQLNNSKGKPMYSFPKSDRFPNKALNSACKAAFYDLPHHHYRFNRTAAFGYGWKYDFTTASPKTPGPCMYSIDRSLEKKENFSFGLGRDKVSLNGIFPKRLYHGEAPGPGNYLIPFVKLSIDMEYKKLLFF